MTEARRRFSATILLTDPAAVLTSRAGPASGRRHHWPPPDRPHLDPMDNASRYVADRHGGCNRARHRARRVVANLGVSSPRDTRAESAIAPRHGASDPIYKTRTGPGATLPADARGVGLAGARQAARIAEPQSTWARWHGDEGRTMERVKRGLRIDLGQPVWLAERTDSATKIPDAMACNVRTARGGHWWSNTAPRQPVSAHLAQAIVAYATTSDALPYNVRTVHAGHRRPDHVPRRPLGANPLKLLVARAKISDALPYNVRTARAGHRRSDHVPRRPVEPIPPQALVAGAKIPDALPYNVRTTHAGHRRSDLVPPRTLSATAPEILVAKANIPDALPYNVRTVRAGHRRSDLPPPPPVRANPSEVLVAKPNTPNAMPYNVRSTPKAQRGRGHRAPPTLARTAPSAITRA
jgi:hypothetical protein